MQFRLYLAWIIVNSYEDTDKSFALMHICMKEPSFCKWHENFYTY